MGSLSLLQGIYATQGSKPGFPHGTQILYQLSHKGKTPPNDDRGTQPPDPLEPKEPPPTNQRTVCELITTPTTPLPLRAFKSAPLNLIEEFGGSEDQLPWTPYLLQGTFLHSLVSVGFALLCAGEWTQVWVGNTSSTKLPPSTGNVSRRGGGG